MWPYVRALTRHPELFQNVPLASELTSDAGIGKARCLSCASSTGRVRTGLCRPSRCPSTNYCSGAARVRMRPSRIPIILPAAKKADIELSPMTGDQMAELTRRTLSVPQRVIERYKAAVP